MERECLAFQMDNVKEAWDHMTREKFEMVENYGDRAYGHFLHTWDEGRRYMVRCRSCGGYVLIQTSEFHSMMDDDDSYYIDCFPVSGPADAKRLNRLYDGYDIERYFTKRYLMITNVGLSWCG